MPKISPAPALALGRPPDPLLAPSPREPAVATSWAARFGQTILRGGIAALPTALYLYQGILDLSAQEVWFVSAVLAHKWDAALPYPNLHTMEGQSGISLRHLKRIRASLEARSYLTVIPRYDASGRQTASSYDFTTLLARLETALRATPAGDNGVQAEPNCKGQRQMA